MAVYKVAQDVEADDKLLGPFTARQFIYLIIVALAGMIAYFLSRILLPLMIIPLPVIVFFGALALPLRKDQPMETYLAAMISFNLKPRKRFWMPDGIESLVDIIAPRVEEVQRTKSFGQDEAMQRLSYLADIVDTEGWAVRHAIAGDGGTSMISDVYNTAQATEDVLDANSAVGESLDSMIAQADQRRRQDMIDRMHNPVAPAPAPPVAPPVVQQPTYAPPAPYPQAVATVPPALPPQQQLQTYQQPAPQPQQATQEPSDIHFNPYPTIHQSVIQPLASDDQVQSVVSQPAQQPTVTPPVQDSNESTSENTVSPDIIKLVNNPDLSIETIAREAHRIKEKDQGDEVVISLR